MRRVCLAALMLFVTAVTDALAQVPVSGSSRSTDRKQMAEAKEPNEAAMLQQQLAAAEGEEAGSSAASSNGEGPEGIVPATKGFNASIGTTSQHDSTTGWASLLTPNVAYRFDKHFSFNAGTPVFAYVNASATTSKLVLGVPIYSTSPLNTQRFLVGDTTLTGQYETHAKQLDYNVTVTVAMPTGDYMYGLGAGQVTYEFNNHFERPVGETFTPNIELGIGDSATLTDLRVRRDYVIVGTNAHFQAGMGVSLPFNMEFESDAYEDLPLAAQTVTTTSTNGKKGKQLKVTSKSSQESIGEDNGFLNTLDIPLNGHVTLSGFYNRSLRNKVDTAGFSLTFLLRGAQRRQEQAR
jgi:hypothetical protein